MNDFSRNTQWFYPMVAVLALTCFAARPAEARTIMVQAEDIELLAAIDADAPGLSWAMERDHFDGITSRQVHLTERRAMLMQFRIDKIPEDHRIVHAELVVPVVGSSGGEPRFYVWRLLDEWGAGVSYINRSTIDEPKPWNRPGARGVATDRSSHPTGTVRVEEHREVVVNVTEDVELWYDGRVSNFGWIFTVEDPGAMVALESPVATRPSRWALRITYEPVGQ